MLKKLLAISTYPFDLECESIGQINIAGYGGLAEGKFLEENQSFKNFSPEELARKLIIHLGTHKGNKISPEISEKIGNEELNKFAKEFLEKNERLWVDFHIPEDDGSGIKNKPFKRVPIPRLEGESDLLFLKRMFDVYHEDSLRLMKESEKRIQQILKKDSQMMEAMRENLMRSKVVADQLAMAEQKPWMRPENLILHKLPNPTEKTNDLLNDLLRSMQQMNQISVNQAKMISSLNDLGVRMSVQTTENIRTATKFNIFTIVTAIISIVFSTGFSIITFLDSKKDSARMSIILESMLAQSQNTLKNEEKSAHMLESIDKNFVKLSRDIINLNSENKLRQKGDD